MPRFAVASETGTLHEVLLCPPDHYRWIPTNAVARRTLASGGQPDPAAIAAQHAELVAALAGAGVAVRLLPPEPQLPYMAYTRDQVVVTPWGPVLCQSSSAAYSPRRCGRSSWQSTGPQGVTTTWSRV